MSDQAPPMRIPDSERDRVAQLLQEHFAQGRLDQEEFTERLSAAYKARTEGELTRVTEDLPEHDLAELQGADRGAEETAVQPLTWRDPAIIIPWALWAGVNVLCFTIWLILVLTTDHSYPWFLWVMFPWGILMGLVTAGVLWGQRSGEDPGPGRG
ncbi:DUF1707 domain-containing protein [Nocardiopsis salina]|uniref:DUF1707 domain-containing protein n=1 Tax=Nocardiopsis salina TaxID=245836 RepID=UPI0003476B82|nr:DUF1707 domain-containing protein [Nocardiopsis salina]